MIFSVIRDIEENSITKEFTLFVEFVVFAVIRRVKRAVYDLKISFKDKYKLKWDISYIVLNFISQSYDTKLLTYKSMKNIENKIKKIFKKCRTI